MARRVLLAFLIPILLLGTGREVCGRMVSVYPQETDEVFSNPLMGWWYIDNAIPGHMDAGRSLPYIKNGTSWELVDHVAILSAWGAIEVEPGRFDWSLIDEAVEFWTSQGKRIHFRISTDPMIMPHVGFVIGAPQWLYDLGVPYKVKDGAGWGKEAECAYPDYTHPLYVTHLKRFLAEFSGRFKDHPAVELVQLMGYGAWGEWHSGYDYPTLEKRLEALQIIIDAWSEAWAGSNVILVLSNSYEWQEELTPYGISINHWPKPSYEEYVRASAFDYAYYQVENIALNRNGLSRYVHDPYDGRLMLEFFDRTRKPISGEIAGSLGLYQNLHDGYNPRRAIDEALNYHVNYLMTLGWDITAFNLAKNPNVDSALYFYNQEYNRLIPYGLRWMGYRLVLTQAHFPGVAAPGETFTLIHAWENRAVGRLYRKYPLGVYLLRDNELVFSAIDESFDPTYIVSGSTYEYQTQITLPEDLPTGEYDLYIALVDEHQQPAIRLPIEGHDGQNRYLLGRIQVKEEVPLPSLANPTRHLLFTEDFESGKPADSGLRVISGEVEATGHSPLTGQYTFTGSSTGPRGDLLVAGAKSLGLKANGTYVISFDYRALANQASVPDNFPAYYFLARSRQGGLGGLRAYQTWQDQPELPWARKTILLTLGPYDDYELVWGADPPGILSIDNLRIEEVDPAIVVLHEGFDGAIHPGLVLHDQAHIETRNAVVGSGSLAMAQDFGQLPMAMQWGFLEKHRHSLEPGTHLRTHTAHG